MTTPDDDMSPERKAALRAELSDCAEFLLPLAQESVKRGPWPAEVAAWLVMVRDSFAVRDEQPH